MTIQPNNQAPKFQDPAETPDRAEETRKPGASKADAVKDNTARDNTVKDDAVKADGAKDKPVAKDGRYGVSDSEVKKSPENKDAKRAPQNQAPVAARTRLFEDQDVTRFREQWRELQAGFVDEPRGAVREADTLVSQMMDSLTAQLAEQKRALQGESDAVDTEQLRVALQRYRSLFDQMLQV